MPELNIDWQHCQNDNWCSFENLNLDHPHFNGMEGVYIIWHTGSNSKVVYVGQGNISERIADHRANNDEILSYRHLGLYVTWAKVGRQYQDGVERYLSEFFKPLVGDQWPDARSISVNSPWQS